MALYCNMLTSAKSAPIIFMPFRPHTISMACIGVRPPTSNVPIIIEQCEVEHVCVVTLYLLQDSW